MKKFFNLVLLTLFLSFLFSCATVKEAKKESIPVNVKELKQTNKNQ
ncbi:hypothetical protein Calab_0124 [Caldithrix abyssi DSM 13497]|uniref:Lipoprotein n=1 Tax=Caldithrix abyssi DSM 13497 TaxID=880073 RepID=H1XXV4_CALAY|nr:hypothetical protein [Caldithrix abyssi]APF19661.1 hypothetical protein Cabys_2913 [Caldithrix abyssi DSM 13497]EHO39777.1 hypothetical protein Calab_0124 [Caldithrix abyssi DSM 13497]